MFSRKKAHENIDPLSKGVASKKGHAVNGQDVPLKVVQGKVKRAVAGNKRSAFGDLTNATKEKNVVLEGKKKLVKTSKPCSNIPVSKPSKSKEVRKPSRQDAGGQCLSSQESLESFSSDVISSSQESVSSNPPVTAEIVDTNFHEEELEIQESTQGSEPFAFRGDLVEFDKEHFDDVFNVGRYAQDIFDYYRRRERMFPIPDYMNGKHQINPGMRSILVDWMVEVQENFELNHETLYLAVKLTDMYLSAVNVKKEALQLVGAAAVFIAAKFDERFPPLIEDFTYVCDNVFDRQEFLEMEMEVLRRIGFDLGIPISYRFLRRYAKICGVSMRTLTLARFILEMSLMEYDLVMERDSRVAAAALCIAMRMTEEGEWDGDVVRSSGYTFTSLTDVVKRLNTMLLAPPVPQLPTIRSKYAHKVFHEVTKIEVLPTEMLLS